MHGRNLMRKVVAQQAIEHAERAARLVRTIEGETRDEAIEKLSLAKLVRAMSVEWQDVDGQFGETRELAQEFARRAGRNFEPQRVLVPFEVLTRDLGKATASAGGYLVATGTTEVIDILRPWSVVTRAGVTVETGFVADSVVPKTSAKATPYWLSDETSQITPSAPTVGQTAVTPKTAGALVQFSRQLSLQANAEGYIQRELLKTIGTALDQAVLNGSGASGQPRGLLGTTGLGTVTGASLAYSGVTSMKRQVADANAPDEEISYIATPAVREMLENRERATGSGFIWDDDRVASRPALVTTDMPAATMVCGTFSAIYVPVWGNGVELMLNPYESTGFKAGTILARVLLSCDVVILHPSAFCKAESIT